MIMMIIGDDFFPSLDDHGGFANVGEVLSGSDLRVGDAVVRHQRRPRVQTNLKKFALL
jgi:hypothetical protein